MRMLLASIVGVLVVVLPAQGARQAESKAMTIRLVSITTKYKLLKDVAPVNTFSSGDTFWARSSLRNEVPQFGKPKGAVIGSDVSTFTVVSLTTGDVTVAAKLPGGTLRAAGRIRQRDRLQRIRVVGGTGVFAGARGVAETSPLNANGDRARNVYRLQLP